MKPDSPNDNNHNIHGERMSASEMPSHTLNQSNTTTDQVEFSTQYAPTIRAFALAVCRAMFLPAFILFVDWELRDGYNIVSLRGAICRGTMLIPVSYTHLTLPTIYSV